MRQLCMVCATQPWPDNQLTRRIFEWTGDIGPRGDSLPLRIAGALHALHLRDQIFDGVYPPASVDDACLWESVAKVMQSHEEFIDSWINSAPQTNEVRRASVLIAAGHVIADLFGKPIRTRELGASGGLNMCWDQYGLQIDGQTWGNDENLVLTPDWSGPLPPNSTLNVVDRQGVDLNPLDPRNPADALRLQAYLWADQTDRLHRTKKAMKVAVDRPEKGDAIDWLATKLDPITSTTLLIYHTVAWQYFPVNKQALGTQMIEAAGDKATPDTPLAWLSMENDGSDRGAAVDLRFWPGNVTINLGRADFHGRWIDWSGTAETGKS